MLIGVVKDLLVEQGQTRGYVCSQAGTRSIFWQRDGSTIKKKVQKLFMATGSFEPRQIGIL